VIPRLSTHIDDPSALGRRLREARLAAGLSQRRLAFPGCSPGYISRLEAGDRTPSLQLLRELARRLGVSESWLALGREPDGVDAVAAEVALRLGEDELAAELLARVEERAALARVARLAQATPPDEPPRAGPLVAAGILPPRESELARAAADPDSSTALAALVALAQADAVAGRAERARERLRRALDLDLPAGDAMTRARGWWRRSRAAAAAGDEGLAAELAARALALLAAEDDPQLAARARRLLAETGER
jgi:transcriptional regulator with XRE-family HTH domain